MYNRITVRSKAEVVENVKTKHILYLWYYSVYTIVSLINGNHIYNHPCFNETTHYQEFFERRHKIDKDDLIGSIDKLDLKLELLVLYRHLWNDYNEIEEKLKKSLQKIDDLIEEKRSAYCSETISIIESVLKLGKLYAQRRKVKNANYWSMTNLILLKC